MLGCLYKESHRIKELEDENRLLKRMNASLALDHQMAKEALQKSVKALS